MAHMRLMILVLLALLITIPPTGMAGDKSTKSRNTDDLQRILELDGSTVHDAGNIALLVTNWGEFGSSPGAGLPFSFAPSFQWPTANSAEYLYTAGLWVGALKGGVPGVSTAAFERELRPTPDPIDIIYRSAEGTAGGNRLPHPNPNDDNDGATNEEVLNGRDDDGDSMIDEDYAAISDQMFSCEYFDNEPAAQVIYPQHRPLDIRVRQESYVWDESRFDDIVGIKFTITNIGTVALQDVYVGMFVDGDVGHRNRPNYWEDDAAASTQFPVTCTNLGPVNPRVAYMYDADGDEGASLGYMSVQFVGHPTDVTSQIAPPDIGFTSFHIFSGSQSFENGGDPTNDFERYEVMSDATIDRDRLTPRDYRMLISVGPFSELLPGQDLVVHVAFAIGTGFNGMRFNSFNAVHAFRGEWFDADQDQTTGVAGRETPVPGPAQNVVIDACENPPTVVPSVPAGSVVWANTDCAVEELYQMNCANMDSTLTMTGVGGNETQENWYIAQDDVVPVLIQQFDAEAADDYVRLSWQVFADEPITGYRVYRSHEGSAMQTISDGTLAPHVAAFEDHGVTPHGQYGYVLSVVLPDGRELHSAPQTVRMGLPELTLVQNHPNPFNPTTTIAFTLPERGVVTLAIYDVRGNRVRSLVDDTMPAGANEIEWDGKDDDGHAVSSGVYLYRLTTVSGVVAKKMTLLK